MKSTSFLIMLCALVASNNTFAQQTYIDQFPTISKILTEIKGEDKIDTYLKQAGTLYIIGEMVHAADGVAYNELSNKEAKLKQDYRDKSDELYKLAVRKIKTSFKGKKLDDELRFAYSKCYSTYSSASRYRPSVYRKFFNDEIQAVFEPIVCGILIQGYKGPKQEESFTYRIDNLFYIELIVMIGFFILTITVVRARMRKKYGLDREDPCLFHGGFADYHIYTFTGVVVSASSNTVTTRTFTSDQNGNRYGHYTTDHDKFFVKDPEDGVEHDVHLIDSGIMLRPGHRISAIWMIKKGFSSGKYVYFFNHDTRRPTVRTRELKNNISVSQISYLPMAVTLYLMIDLIFRPFFGDEPGREAFEMLQGLQFIANLCLLVSVFFFAYLKRKDIYHRFLIDVNVILKRLDDKASKINPNDFS